MADPSSHPVDMVPHIHVTQLTGRVDIWCALGGLSNMVNHASTIPTEDHVSCIQLFGIWDFRQ